MASVLSNNAAAIKRRLRSLALSVHFRHDALGMKDYEILSRATAFLLAVDPPDPAKDSTPGGGGGSSSTYKHLLQSEQQKRALLHRQNYAYEPAGGPTRPAEQLKWLEFCPTKFRPMVHVIASSHVVSPWLWKKYYSQPWLDLVQQEHVQYSIQVLEHYPNQKLASFPLHPCPIHHPSGLDLALMHLKDEDNALQQLKDLGVQIHHLVDPTTETFEPGQGVSFDGYHVASEYDDAYLSGGGIMDTPDTSTNTSTQGEDTRVFVPFTATGKLIYASPTRFLATTDQTLPEGLCGGPVFNQDNTHVCGVIEGIVPKDHTDPRIAGAAAFIPSFTVYEFIDYAEKIMLQRILPKALFDAVVDIKSGQGLNPSSSKQTITLNEDEDDETTIPQNVSSFTNKPTISTTLDEMYNEFVHTMKKTLSPEQVEAVLATIERERQEVMDIIQREGGDLDSVIEKVRFRTREQQAKILRDLATSDAEYKDMEPLQTDESNKK